MDVKTWTLAEAERDFETIYYLAVKGEVQVNSDGERAVVLLPLSLYQSMKNQKAERPRSSETMDDDL